MGCAVASCQGKEWSTYLVCQYDPPGNVIGEQLFAHGPACSACPMGHETCDGSLCRGATPPVPAQTVVMDLGCGGARNFSVRIGDCTAGPPGSSWKSQVVRVLPIGQQWMAQLQFCIKGDCEECHVARPQTMGACDSALNFPSAFRFSNSRDDGSSTARVSTPIGAGLAASPSPVVMFSTQLRVKQGMPMKLRSRGENYVS
mmetsp:Transcript_41179/g.93088  ORF Transcript_41179/g.93088 Transcript_41179/m.93088 type:complete len:201 (-) Transcript_41179:11-613(-)